MLFPYTWFHPVGKEGVGGHDPHIRPPPPVQAEKIFIKNRNSGLLQQSPMRGPGFRVGCGSLFLDHRRFGPVLTRQRTFLFNSTPYWRQEHCILNARRKAFLPEHHTAGYLADALRRGTKITAVFEEKRSTITINNAVNITAAIRELGWKWLNCFGHNLILLK